MEQKTFLPISVKENKAALILTGGLFLLTSAVTLGLVLLGFLMQNMGALEIHTNVFTLAIITGVMALLLSFFLSWAYKLATGVRAAPTPAPAPMPKPAPALAQVIEEEEVTAEAKAISLTPVPVKHSLPTLLKKEESRKAGEFALGDFVIWSVNRKTGIVEHKGIVIKCLEPGEIPSYPDWTGDLLMAINLPQYNNREEVSYLIASTNAKKASAKKRVYWPRANQLRRYSPDLWEQQYYKKLTDKLALFQAHNKTT